MNKISKSITRPGAASLFIVVFSILLLTIISLSFIRIALRGAKTAGENDLSQSAYDSAMSGVEDAKRAAVAYTENCVLQTKTDLNEEDCKTLSDKYDGSDCDVIPRTFKISPGDEQKLTPGGSGSHDANQAYTCVKITYDTNDYLGEIGNLDDSVIIPLRAVSGGVEQVEINWFSSKDLSSQSANINLPVGVDISKLPTDVEWDRQGYPPIMVAQYFKVDNLGSYDINSGSPSFRTRYLYPADAGGNIDSFALDARGYDDKQDVPMTPIKCKSDFSEGLYACRATIKLPESIPAKSGKHFIRLSKRYSAKASYQVKLLLKDGGVVKFSGVQPSVDSNGRAGDFFRRVESRINLSITPIPTMALPSAATEVSKGDFCKRLTIDDSDSIPKCE